MAVKTKGTAHLYWIAGTVSNATVLSFTSRKSHLAEDETTDESGHQIERRYDDEMEEVTVTLRMQAAYSVPGYGTNLTYDSVTYEIVSVDKNEEAKGFRTLTITAKKSEFISY